MPRRLCIFKFIHMKSEICGHPLISDETWVYEEWNEIANRAEQIRFGDNVGKIYVDSLSEGKDNCTGFIYSKEEAISITIEDENRTNGRLPCIVRALVKRGADLVATEKKEYVDQNWRLIRQVNIKNQPLSSQQRDEHAKLTQDRDIFMAHRINDTLTDGDLGILFVGKAHRVEKHLDKDIAVNILFTMSDRPMPVSCFD